jgi:ElaB/YqjD/DUF883 family membrane-anchored ribosome-binding protein
MTLALGLLALPGSTRAQERTPVAKDQEELTTFATAHAAIEKLRDQIQHELAESGNKTDAEQKQLREKLQKQIVRILASQRMTEEQYQRLTYEISTDPERRRLFEEALALIAAKKRAPR